MYLLYKSIKCVYQRYVDGRIYIENRSYSAFKVTVFILFNQTGPPESNPAGPEQYGDKI
jgi:hypothetical protein